MKPKRNKVQTTKLYFSVPDLWEHFYKFEKGDKAMGKEKYCRLARHICKRLMQETIVEPYFFNIPHRLGKLKIKKTNYKVDNVDFKRTKEEGRLIINPHKKRYPIYIYQWVKSNGVPNGRYYRFRAVKGKPEEYYGREGLQKYVRDNLDNPFAVDFERL